MEDIKVKPLSEMQTGQTGTVTAFTGNHENRQRLLSIGICVGCEIELLVRGPGRDMVAVNEARLAIGVEAAEGVLVAAEEVEDTFSQAVNRLKAIWSR
jgi:Fe2+ transport system protein FeoA